MVFIKRLSTKQESAIVICIIGLVLFFSRNGKSAGILLGIVSVVMVLGSINDFIAERTRKKKIINRFQKNRYDSNEEETVANYFKRKNVVFEHHPTIKVEKFWWKLSIPFASVNIEPDFYLPEFDIYVEYWGMIDDPKYKEEQYDRKKKLYQDNGLDLLSLYPKNLRNLDFDFTSKFMELIKKREGIQRKYR